jgi:hypothetical protein
LPGVAGRLLRKCFALVGSQRDVGQVVEHLEFLPGVGQSRALAAGPG